MTIQGSSKTRSLAWEEEAASAETRFRRADQSVPSGGRYLPGMPLEMPDPDDDDSSRLSKSRFGHPRGPWWRPQTNFGRGLLAGGAVLFLGGILAGALALKSYIARDIRFHIAGTDSIQADGITEISRTELLPVFGEDIGRNIFFIPLDERRKQLEKIPWVEHATVMRVLPDQIRVSVIERKPVAFVHQGSQIGLVDAEGVLLSMPAAMMTQHHYSFPVVTGIDPQDSPEARKSRMTTYLRLLSELDTNNQHLSDQISEIDLTNPEDARILMPEQGTDILAHFGEERFLERYQRYKAHIAEWKTQYPQLASVDLRYEQQVVLEMNKNATNTDSTTPAAANPNTQSASNTSPTAAAPALRPAALTTHHVAPKPKKSDPKKTSAKKTASKKKVAPKKNANAKSTQPPKKHPEPKHTALNAPKKTALNNHHSTATRGQG